jgi:predicted lipoprotein with Yx(FWY)xxD motif
MRTASLLLIAGLLALAGCGDGDDDAAAPKQAPGKPDPATTKESAPKPPVAKGTAITLDDSEFGPMLFDSRKQAIYIFQRDRQDRTVCYGACAEAWPPVLTKGRPQADDGVQQSLLGTIERRDGSRQVTYAGKPLYFYANEPPGEVSCHDVYLNGGFWWAIGPDGKRRP